MTPPSSATDDETGHSLTMPVWQFVRLMVKIEATLDQFTDTSLQKLYDEWEDFWADLDAKLLDVGHRSREEFANLMMDQEVAMHDVTDIQIGLIRRELLALSRQIRHEASQCQSRQDKRNLNYEAREIDIFISELQKRD